MSARIVRRTAAVLAAATAAALTLGAGSASAYNDCPRGWDIVPTGGRDLNGVQQFCRQLNTTGHGPDQRYVVQMRADRVYQGSNGAGINVDADGNPYLLRRSVASWMENERAGGDIWSLAINGTYYYHDDTRAWGAATALVSFPVYTYDPWYPGSFLLAPGKHPSREGSLAAERHCMSWSRRRSTVRNGPWTLANNDPADTLREIHFGETCPASSQNGEFVVAFDPLLEVDRLKDDKRNSLTIVGKKTTGNGMVLDDTMCFLVGGWQTRAEAAEVLWEEFACRAIMQMDGGNSSQLSYTDTSTGEIVSLVTGYQEHNRPVPHYLAVR